MNEENKGNVEPKESLESRENSARLGLEGEMVLQELKENQGLLDLKDEEDKVVHVVFKDLLDQMVQEVYLVHGGNLEM